MHQDDRERVETVIAQALESGANGALVRLDQYFAIGTDPLVDLDHALGQLLGQLDVAREDVGSRLRPDPQRIGEPARDCEGEPLPLAFEQFDA